MMNSPTDPAVPPEAYEAAAMAYDEALHRMLDNGRVGRVLGDKGRSDLAANDCFRAAVDAVWSLAVAEGRRQAADALAELQTRFDRHMWGHDWKPGLDVARCRHCGFGKEGDPASHCMDCRLYAGPLRHEWIRTRYNPTFGGVDYYCLCGGSVRVHDAQTTSEPTCPKVSEVWRGAARIAEGNTDANTT